MTTTFKSQSALISALVDMGFKSTEIEVHETPTKLKGYHGDHTNLNGNVVVRRAAMPGAYNDLGFETMEDGTIQTHISDATGSHSARCRVTDTTKELGIKKMNTDWLDALTQRYARHVLAEEAEQHGMWVSEEGWNDGELYVHLTDGT